MFRTNSTTKKWGFDSHLNVNRNLKDVILQDFHMLQLLYKDHLPPYALHKQNKLTSSLFSELITSSVQNESSDCLPRLSSHPSRGSWYTQTCYLSSICMILSAGMCSFSVASSGRRCVLETLQLDSGDLEFQCKSSEVTAIDMPAYIETDECMSACGLDRKSVGISSDTLLETKFTLKLCSPQCYYNCPNIIDLYQNLALAEGVFLSELCKSQKTSSRRSAIQLQSSSEAAPGPVSAAGGPTSAAYGPGSSTTLSSVDCAPAPM